ncbi:pyruvate dehydrogenase E1 component alpha subunit [Paenibacillus sp. yr247]|uniref:thiamine pyrophosphate-dependent dehydrogenase E1 component subunit alpha n=1 Tax=Paenibacillus sp. yr247 TaxID=1761880 RepID=UPI0008818752|nr:thiamine pyrophosphate-dependent dehydrogenase E1 component subunit alpha [Paenibacillus sp. yr247]SDO48539.1 pyruvate dehydrogenase E1 component alpha subunit [Paenibacillus sp. yr247]
MLPGTTKQKLLAYEKELLLDILYKMYTIRIFEEKVEQLFMRGKIHGTMHLCIGQEGTAAGACAMLEPADKITSTHRGHGHCIAKGTDINRMMAEILGKSTGYCKGKGGSMHIADLETGNLGANGIVAGGHSLAVGAALTSQMRELGYVVLCFFGDGATNEGNFHESLNLASIWKLPVIFFCENNGYAMSGPIKEMVNIENLADRAVSYGIPGVVVDGSNVIEIMDVTNEAVKRARSGLGPTLIEAKTYRWKGHSKSDARKYRAREEEQEWINQRDPILLFKKQLIEEGFLTEEQDLAMRASVLAEVDAAVDFAESSPSPDIDTLKEDVYA